MLFDGACGSKSNILIIFGITIRTVWTNCRKFYFEPRNFSQEKRGIDRIFPIQHEETESMPLLSKRNMLEGAQVICLWCSNGIDSIFTHPYLQI